MFTAFQDDKGLYNVPHPDNDVVWPCDYLVYQEESCPDTGKDHLQGYVVFSERRRLSACKKVHATAHWEPRRGTHEQAVQYCTKEVSRKQDGLSHCVGAEGAQDGGQGTRTDLQQLQADLDEGMDMRTVSQVHFSHFLRYEKGIQKYMNLNSAPRTKKTLCICLHGLPGTGKSFLAQQLAGPKAFSWAKGMWWDGYDSVSPIVADDFVGTLPVHLFKSLFDAYPQQAAVKGAFINFAPELVVFTSNKHPSEWYQHEPWEATCFDPASGTVVTSPGAVHRRLEYIVHWRGYDPPLFTVEREPEPESFRRLLLVANEVMTPSSSEDASVDEEMAIFCPPSPTLSLPDDLPEDFDEAIAEWSSLWGSESFEKEDIDSSELSEYSRKKRKKNKNS